MVSLMKFGIHRPRGVLKKCLKLMKSELTLYKGQLITLSFGTHTSSTELYVVNFMCQISDHRL